MRKRSYNGGIIALGDTRIQYDFMLEGVRYRPSLVRAPTAANLRRAREHLRQIKGRIRAGTFSFAEDYRELEKVSDASQLRTCDRVFDGFLEHVEALVQRGGLSAATLLGYRRALDSIWRPQIGPQLFLEVPFSTLARIADSQKAWSRKTYNNNLVALRRAFAYGYRNHPQAFNPAAGLKGVRLGPREQPKPDPFRISEAETVIAGIHEDWGEAQGNYDEFRFFTGLRPSEEIALHVRDYNAHSGTLAVNKACVMGVYKNCTKTRQDRVVQLCPRAVFVLERQLKLRERLRGAGLIAHDFLFFHEDGEPIRRLHRPGHRWGSTLRRLGIRYRKPYACRHTSVSWNLMLGKNPLLNAKQHGHSIATMWRVYTAWTEGALETEIKAIRAAMQGPSPIPLDRSDQPWWKYLRSTAAQVMKSVADSMHGAVGNGWQRICQWNGRFIDSQHNQVTNVYRK